MSKSLDIRFGSIAAAYDTQRAHPPHVSVQIGAAIAAVTRSGAQVLELGVGTGRIALPAARAGCRVTGIDISREMLQVAQTQVRHASDSTANGSGGMASGWAAPTLIQGDISRLPLRDSAFDAVLAVHVLHLAPDWRGALAEAWRVLRPGGVFVQGRDWRDPQSCAERLRGKLREVVMGLLPGARPPGAGAAIGQALARLGGRAEQDVVAVKWTGRTSPAAVIAAMAGRADAETWVLEEAVLSAAVAQVRDWAANTWDDLAAEQEIEQRFVLSVLRKPLGEVPGEQQ
jgi:SAM-dependent methyltransferase